MVDYAAYPAYILFFFYSRLVTYTHLDKKQ